MLSSQLNLTNSLQQTLQRTHFGINELLGLDNSATQNLLVQQQQRVAHQLGSVNNYTQSCHQPTSQSAEQQLFDSFNSQTFANSGGYLSAANRIPQNASQYFSGGLYGKATPFQIFSSGAAHQPCKLNNRLLQVF